MKLIFISHSPAPSERPVFYLKPDTALLRNNQPFFYPDFTADLRATLSLVLRLNRLGRSISKQFAARYFDAVSIGMDIAAYDLLHHCQQKNQPQDCARSFDYAAPISPDFVPVAEDNAIRNYALNFLYNGQEIQASAPLLPYSPEEIIAGVSQFLTLKIGDYIYINTPLTTPPLQIGDKLTAFLNGKEMLRVEIK